MEYVITTEQMRRCDRNTSEYYGIPEAVLMERAALAVVRAVREVLADTRGAAARAGGCFPARIMVLCGSGNNGADGYAAARLLFQQGYEVHALFCGNEEKRSDLNRMQLKIAERYGVCCRTIHVREHKLYAADARKDKKSEYDIGDAASQGAYDLIVDALFGIGLSRPVAGDAAEVMKAADGWNIPVVAVDMPSGISSENGSVLGCALHARTTVTFGFRKLGLVLFPGAAYAGEARVEEIGITADSFLGSLPTRTILHEDDIRSILPEREPGGNKGTFGKILIMAGSPGMSGACTLAALGAYRAGAGMVRIVTCEENREILQRTVPEALLTVLNEDMQREEKEHLLDEAASWADVAAIGPGIGKSNETRENFQILYTWMCAQGREKPLILDADALNLLAEPGMPERCLVKRDPGMTVLTPHIGEFARLCGQTAAVIKNDFLHQAEAFAIRTGCILAAKDARTYICEAVDAACGAVRGCMNVTGNDGMATAGSGDVLTGIIAAFAATVPNLYDAACAGVWVHGTAGDTAAGLMGKEALMASDLIAGVPEVMKRLRAGRGESLS